MTNAAQATFEARLHGLLVENSELAHFDTLAILAALDRQTEAIQQLLNHLQHNIPYPQQNNNPPVSVYQPDTRVIQLDGARPIDAAIAWLRENDPDLRLTAREAAVRASMSQATINRAQQKLRGK